MKWNSILAICFSILTFSAWSQDKKYWSDQKLQLGDFEGSPAGAAPFQIKYDIVYSKKIQRIERTTHWHYQAKAIFIPSQSWIVYDSLQELRLRYCNVIFDFVELYARRFDDEINVASNMESSKAETIRALNDAVALLASDTKIGTDRKRVAFWEHHIDSVLRMTYRKEIPDFHYDRLTIGYSLGGAYNYLTGNLGNQFSSPIAAANGFYLTWKRVRYAVQLTALGRSKPSKGYYSEFQQFGDTAEFVMNYHTFTVGYEIIRKPQFQLTPYAGMSTMRMFLVDDDINDKKYTNPLKASFNAGLALDFRSKPFFQSNTSQFRYGLAIRANYSPYTYLPKLAGNCLSFTLGLSIYMDLVKNYL